MDQTPVPKPTSLGPQRPSLLPRGVREKLVVAFSLMSIIPLLVLGYVVMNYVFPHLDLGWDLLTVLALALVLALLGHAVAKGLVMPVVKLASEAQEIAGGNYQREVDVHAPDEIGTIGAALNQITQRVRDNMSQLHDYGEQTKRLNLEINKRILSLSHLLQVSNLIAQSATLEEIRTFILERLAQLEEAECNCLLEPAEDGKGFVVAAAVCTDSARAQALLGTQVAGPWLVRALQEAKTLVIDADAAARDRELVESVFGMTNAVCQPLVSMGRGIGLLVSANRTAHFTFTSDTLELLRIFAKQMAIAIENDLLTKRAEELKVVDELTGLYNAQYMRPRLDEELRRAMRYHRPCSLILLNADHFRQFQELYGGLATESALRQLATLIKGQVTEVDRVGRMGPDEFAVILPERNKREAIELAQAICQRVAQHPFMNGTQRVSRPLTVSGGISENPIDGATAEQLWAKAAEFLKLAKLQGKNQVVAQ